MLNGLIPMKDKVPGPLQALHTVTHWYGDFSIILTGIIVITVIKVSECLQQVPHEGGRDLLHLQESGKASKLRRVRSWHFRQKYKFPVLKKGKAFLAEISLELHLLANHRVNHSYLLITGKTS